MYSKKDIVNACLIAMGSSTVPSLDNPDVDTDICINVYETALLAVLGRGWWFNRETWAMAPDSKGEVQISQTVLKFEVENAKDLLIVRRQGRMYSQAKQTFNIAEALDGQKDQLCVSTTVMLDISDCPLTAQLYIRQKAISDTHALPSGNSDKLQASQVREIEYLSKLEQEDIANTGMNSYRLGSSQAILSHVDGGAGGFDYNVLGSRE